MSSSVASHPEIQQPKWQDSADLQRNASGHPSYAYGSAHQARGMTLLAERKEREAMLSEKPWPISEDLSSEKKRGGDADMDDYKRKRGASKDYGDRMFHAEGGEGNRVDPNFSPSFRPIDDEDIALGDYRRNRRKMVEDKRSDHEEAIQATERRTNADDMHIPRVRAYQPEEQLPARYRGTSKGEKEKRDERGQIPIRSVKSPSSLPYSNDPYGTLPSWESYPLRRRSAYMPVGRQEAEVDYDTGVYRDLHGPHYSSYTSKGSSQPSMTRSQGCSEPPEWDSGRYLEPQFAVRLPQQAEGYHRPLNFRERQTMDKSA